MSQAFSIEKLINLMETINDATVFHLIEDDL